MTNMEVSMHTFLSRMKCLINLKRDPHQVQTQERSPSRATDLVAGHAKKGSGLRRLADL